MKRRIRFLIAAALLLSAAVPSYAGSAKKGWTKVVLTHADGGGGEFPSDLIERFGGEMLSQSNSQAVAYIPANAFATLKAEARKSGIAVSRRDDFDVLHLPSDRIDVREGIRDDVPQSERIHEYPARKPGLFVIQFVAPARAEWVEELVSMGWHFDRYVPTNGYIIIGTPELIGRTKQLPYIQFLDFYHPYQKAKDLVRDGVEHDLELVLSSLTDPSDGIDAIKAVSQGGVRVSRGARDTLVYARLAHQSAESLLHHRLVVAVGPRAVWELSDERQLMSLTSHVNSSGSAPTQAGYKAWLTGRCPTCSSMVPSQWKIGLADTGLDNGLTSGGHDALAGRKYYGTTTYGTSHDTCTNPGTIHCDKRGHGTIVAGIMVGDPPSGDIDAGGYLWGTGVLPWASVFSTKGATEARALDFNDVDEFTKDAADNDITIQNHSFNNYLSSGAGLYTASARRYDLSVRDAYNDDDPATVPEPLLITVSAGNNDQGDTTNRERVQAGGTAKNVIAVGALENNRPDVTGCNASGDDFRNILATSRTGTLLANYIKPDLVAVAGPIASANSSEIDYDTEYCVDNYADLDGNSATFQTEYNGDSGTSFAAPVAAGASMIVKRYLNGTSPAATSPALAKAMLIAGAKSIRGGIDKSTTPNTTVAAFPNGQQGFGRISLDDIITGSTTPVWYDQAPTHIFTGASAFRIRLRVRDSSKPVKVALVWTDTPAMELATNPLVNNLDLSVYPSSNTTVRYHGNHLEVVDEARGEESTAVGIFEDSGIDITNNVEVVRAFFASNEEFDVRVHAASIMGDTDGDPADFEQDFALVVTNAEKVNGGNAMAPVVTSQRLGGVPTSVRLEWSEAVNMMNARYEVWRGTTLANMAKVHDTTSRSWDNTTGLASDTAYIYQVRAFGNDGAAPPSNNTVATTMVWTDPVIVSRETPVRSQHWTDIRRGIDRIRSAAGLAPALWGSSVAVDAAIAAAQVEEMRTKLTEAYAELNMTGPTFNTSVPTGKETRLRKDDLTDLRTAIE